VTQNEARQTILARIRGAVKSNHDHYNFAEDERKYQRAGQLAVEERLALFVERLREYDAQVQSVETGDVSAAIAGMLRVETQDALPWVVADGFPAAWLAGCPAVLPEAEAGLDELNRCAGVLTVCSVGIALTGTLVLQHGAGEGRRRTSLIPDRHLCVVRASQVVETVPEAFARLADAATRPLTFISGPSATADIEMTRIRGVHGPRQLSVILVRE
jgi:L-lactate dehydrogenase complex protein LldG